MWFSILKNKLLTKPKTQLRIKDVKDIEDDEPCKKKLEEYHNHFKTQRVNYIIHNDTKITNIYNKYGLTNVEENYYNDEAVISRHNNKFKGATLFGYYTANLEKDAFSELPEKVACRLLDLIESVDGYYGQKMDGYELYVENTNRIQTNAHALLDDTRDFTAYIREAGRYVYIISSSGTIIIEEKNSSLRYSTEASSFYNDITEIILDKLDPKNWK